MTVHQHDFPDVSAAGRCRLCTANDREALIEQLAEDLWESRRNGHLDDRPWDEAGAYWQRGFRELAAAAVASLDGGSLHSSQR